MYVLMYEQVFFLSLISYIYTLFSVHVIVEEVLLSILSFRIYSKENKTETVGNLAIKLYYKLVQNMCKLYNIVYFLFR